MIQDACVCILQSMHAGLKLTSSIIQTHREAHICTPTMCYSELQNDPFKLIDPPRDGSYAPVVLVAATGLVCALLHMTNGRFEKNKKEAR